MHWPVTVSGWLSITVWQLLVFISSPSLLISRWFVGRERVCVTCNADHVATDVQRVTVICYYTGNIWRPFGCYASCLREIWSFDTEDKKWLMNFKGGWMCLRNKHKTQKEKKLLKEKLKINQISLFLMLLKWMLHRFLDFGSFDN